jgi:nicotinamide mononucleotide (NMN) deamidase PncC
VWIALADAKGSYAKPFRFIGGRSSVKLKAARKALDLLRLRLS